MTEAAYAVLDARPFAAEAPYTFFLPSPAEIAAVGKGDLVKFLFDYPQETEKWSAERMWVSIEPAEDDTLQCVLDNQPNERTSPLKAGDIIEFSRHAILSIDWKNPDAAPPSTTQREY